MPLPCNNYGMVKALAKKQQFPEHIQRNLEKDENYYSMDIPENIERAKVDEDYLGDVLIVNENLIWHSIHKYVSNPDLIVKNNCLEKDDILQLGRLGFIKSVKAFDTSRGIKFSSFAVTAIVREVRCFLRDSASIIRPTRTAFGLINRIKRIEQEFGYTPSVEELSVLLEEDEEKIKKAIQVGCSVKYLDEPVSIQSQDITLLDTVDSGVGIEDDIIDKVYVDSLLQAVKDKLSEKEIHVLKHRIGGYNQTQTAKKENISQMRVSRIMKKIAKLLEEEVIK
jgi:RNA polymerase sporulation-specific sigma factor